MTTHSANADSGNPTATSPTEPDAASAEGVTVILICHGSRNEAANQAHRDLCAALGEQIGTVVHPAFLELTTPDLATTIAERVSAGADRVVVLPYFLHPGNHTSKDIPALIDAAERARPDVSISLGPLFGGDDAIVGVLANQALNMLA